MTEKRNRQILNAGFKAAREQMRKHPQRPEYPRDFMRLYEWLEDKVFNLYEAICLKKHSHVKTVAADIIVTSSEIAEFAGKKADAEKLKRTLEGGGV
jgi:hypothetical protein